MRLGLLGGRCEQGRCSTPSLCTPPFFAVPEFQVCLWLRTVGKIIQEMLPSQGRTRNVRTRLLQSVIEKVLRSVNQRPKICSTASRPDHAVEICLLWTLACHATVPVSFSAAMIPIAANMAKRPLLISRFRHSRSYLTAGHCLSS